MTDDPGFRIVALKLAQQVEQGTTLGVGAGIGRLIILVQPALITDTYALIVPTRRVRADLVDRAAAVDHAVAGDVEMITDIGEAAGDVVGPQRLDRVVAVVARGATVDYQEAYLPVILVETAGFHPMHEVMPMAPAMAVATAIITLRIVPQMLVLLLSVILICFFKCSTSCSRLILAC